MEVDDAFLIDRLQKRDEKAFEQVFKKNFKNLHAYAFTLLNDGMAAEEMVQNVFFKLWERHNRITISGTVEAYLYKSVYNESLNYLKHLKVRAEHRLYVSHKKEADGGYHSKTLQAKELQQRISEAMNELPEQCRTVFQLSRFEELRYKEIASRLGISVKTVENHMGKALKMLRAKLADFLILVLLFLNSKSW